MDTAAPSSQQKWALPVEPWTLCNPVALETLSRGFILIDNLGTVERHVRPSTSEIAGTCGGLILLDRGRQNPTLCNRPSFHGYRLTECADTSRSKSISNAPHTNASNVCSLSPAATEATHSVLASTAMYGRAATFIRGDAELAPN